MKQGLGEVVEASSPGVVVQLHVRHPWLVFVSTQQGTKIVLTKLQPCGSCPKLLLPAPAAAVAVAHLDALSKHTKPSQLGQKTQTIMMQLPVLLIAAW